MSRILRLFILVLFALAFNACDEAVDSELLINAQIDTVEYGTSFGECIGYCKNTIQITENEMVFISESWNVNPELPDIVVRIDFSIEDWDNLLEDFNYLAFRNLDEVIGCPDCRDQGAEWVKIEANGISHKVTYEYNDPPEEIAEFVLILSNYLKDFLDSEFDQ